jgi:carbamoyltransferase
MYEHAENASAALVKDGVLIAMAEEERFNRIKHSHGMPYPEKAIQFCLDYAGITMNQVDSVSIGWASFSSALWMSFKNVIKRPFFLIKLPEIIRELRSHKKYKKDFELHYYPHHLSHAASAYFCSGFEKANIISMDGQGEASSVYLAVGTDHKEITPIKEFSSLNSIGALYESYTDYLGFKRHSEEGFVMGLASYGRPVHYTEPVIKWKKDGFSCETWPRYKNIMKYSFRKLQGKKIDSFNELLKEVYGPKRNKGEPLEKRHQDLAATIQNIQEKAVVKLARSMYEKTGIRNFCLAGGSSLNCIANGVLLEQDFVDDIFIQPASSDCGCSIGAAFLEYIRLTGKPVDFVMEHAYYGPEWTNDEIKKILDEMGIKYSYHEDIERVSAELVAKGLIIGWFQGRMEFGPRALGNRSIISDPTVEGMNDKVNMQVKHRECYDDKTEILTKDGWKFFKDLTGKEKVATLNPKTNELIYQKPKEMIEYNLSGKMVHFNNKRIDLLVTPNHNIWAKKVLNHNKNGYAKSFEFDKALNLINKEHFQRKAVDKWRGDDVKYFELPLIKSMKYSHLSQYKKIPMDLWLEFLGYYLSEGSICYNNGHHSILISQEKYVKKMKSCLDKLPYKWHYNIKSFRTSNKQLYTYLTQFGKCDDKFISRDFLNLSERQLKILFEALMCGDGHKRGKQCKYFTTSKKLAENVQEICIKLGYSVYTSVEIRKPNRKNLYVVRANKGSKISYVRKNQSSLEDYAGKVYCVNVPKYNILCVKRNEKVVFSGNSWRPFAPSMLLESIDEYLEGAYPSPFMILSFRVKKDKWKVIPAVTHIDGSARPQTVTEKDNPRYYKLIKEFEKIKGVPVVMNTSFNDKGEPIVCSPQEAVRSFKKTNLDYLSIGNFLISREDNHD